jgi:hypothetical protein
VIDGLSFDDRIKIVDEILHINNSCIRTLAFQNEKLKTIRIRIQSEKIKAG